MIRKLQNNDINRVMELWLNSNLEAHDFIPKEYWITNTTAVQEQLLQAEVYVYESDGTVLGFVGMQGNYLAGIFVDSTYRSTGIGKKLLDYVKDIYPIFTLGVYQKNCRAVAFYLREGLFISSEGIEEDTQNIEYIMTWNRQNTSNLCTAKNEHQCEY